MVSENIASKLSVALIPCLALAHALPLSAQINASDSWAKDFLQNLSRLASTDNIKPNSFATRSQLAQGLDLMLAPNTAQPSPQDLPRDVMPSSSSAKAIARLVKQKILSAENGQFQPDRPVTKGEALLAIAKVLSLDHQRMATPQTYLSTMFSDAHTIPKSATTAIAALTTRTLVVNYPDTRQLKFNQPITELELSALIHQGLVYQKRLPRIGSPYIVDPSRPMVSLNVPKVTTLVVNLTKRELTAFNGNTKLKTYRIAVGRAGWETPVGVHRVQQLIERPAWKNPFTGDVIGSGDPDNPLGERWIGFWTNGKDWSGFHGTPNRASVGQAVSHGCIRMYNEDIVELFAMVSPQTVVRVVK